VDLQNDFITGSLAVKGGAEIVPLANTLAASGVYDVVVDTRDWHPADHVSFAVNHAGKKPFDTILRNGGEQVLWPVHCVQNTDGAEFFPELDQSHTDFVVQKGTHADADSYSGFFDEHGDSTGLLEYLREQNVSDVDVIGLAPPYCVSLTAIHALENGFQTRVIEDACRSIGDHHEAMDKLRAAGIKVIDSADILSVV
jgi:nicotinamidase/pyrazinamidase